jgi:hypothetical protein
MATIMMYNDFSITHIHSENENEYINIDSKCEYGTEIDKVSLAPFHGSIENNPRYNAMVSISLRNVKKDKYTNFIIFHDYDKGVNNDELKEGIIEYMSIHFGMDIEDILKQYPVLK